MVPLGKTTTSKKKTTRGRKHTATRTHFKKQPQIREKQETSSAKEGDMESEVADDDVSTSLCSTPKGKKFQIPEISTCPPAPKKQRVLSNCSLRRSPLAFFAPPDLEIFLCVALPDVPVSFVC